MPNELPVRAPAGVYAFAPAPMPEPEPERGTRRRWPRLAALVAGIAFGIALAIGGAQWSSAQRRDTPRIDVAPTIVAEPASQAPLVIRVTPTDGLPGNTFLRLRGFPASVSLTEGYAIAPGAWAIPLLGLSSLKAIVPAGVSGRNEISISLVGVDGTTLAESRTALVIAAPTPPPERVLPEPQRPTVPLVAPSERIQPEPRARQFAPVVAPPPVRRAVPELSEDDRARAERMLAQGAKHLEQGNIGAARLFFQRAAEVGLAAAAIKMGATYDPVELARGPALAGVSADRNEARKWYERARDLGAPDAEDRLGRLTGR
jgi:hypothetical protein